MLKVVSFQNSVFIVNFCFSVIFYGNLVFMKKIFCCCFRESFMYILFSFLHNWIFPVECWIFDNSIVDIHNHKLYGTSKIRPTGIGIEPK